MTPMFIQEPFWNLTYSLPQALAEKGIAIQEDIASILRDANILKERS